MSGAGEYDAAAQSSWRLSGGGSNRAGNAHGRDLRFVRRLRHRAVGIGFKGIGRSLERLDRCVLRLMFIAALSSLGKVQVQLGRAQVCGCGAEQPGESREARCQGPGAG